MFKAIWFLPTSRAQHPGNNNEGTKKQKPRNGALEDCGILPQIGNNYKFHISKAGVLAGLGINPAKICTKADQWSSVDAQQSAACTSICSIEVQGPKIHLFKYTFNDVFKFLFSQSYNYIEIYTNN